MTDAHEMVPAMRTMMRQHCVTSSRVVSALVQAHTSTASTSLTNTQRPECQPMLMLIDRQSHPTQHVCPIERACRQITDSLQHHPRPACVRHSRLCQFLTARHVCHYPTYIHAQTSLTHTHLVSSYIAPVLRVLRFRVEPMLLFSSSRGTVRVERPGLCVPRSGNILMFHQSNVRAALRRLHATPARYSAVSTTATRRR